MHMAQLMPMPLTVSCSSKIQIGFTVLVLAHPGSPGKGAIKCVCVRALVHSRLSIMPIVHLLRICKLPDTQIFWSQYFMTLIRQSALPISIMFCHLDHLVANRMAPSMCPNHCGTRWGSWFQAILYHISATAIWCLYTHTHTRLTALFQDYPGQPVPER